MTSLRKANRMKIPKLERLARFLLDLLFPPRCVFCGEIVPPGTQVCENCAKTIAPCGSVRSLTLPKGGEKVPCAALYPYDGKVRDSILRYKFHGEKQNADYYTEKMAILVKIAFPDHNLSLVTWVPLSEERKKERGYDQAERLARQLAKALKLPCIQCLRKAKSNRVQHFLNRGGRAGNVRGVYTSQGTETMGKNLLLVDDIVTTGATLAECASVLQHAGAASIRCITVAQAELEHVEKSALL